MCLGDSGCLLLDIVIAQFAIAFRTVMWDLLRVLPEDILVENVLNQLKVQDLVRLDEAWPTKHRQELNIKYFSRLQAINISKPLHASVVMYEWLLRHCIPIKSLLLLNTSLSAVPLISKHSTLVETLATQWHGTPDDTIVMHLSNYPVLSKMVNEISIDDDGYQTCGQVGVGWKYIASFTNLQSVYIRIHSEADVTNAINLFENCTKICALSITQVPYEAPSLLHSLFRVETLQNLSTI